MSGIGDALFGSSPSVQQTSASNLDPAQLGVQGNIASVLNALFTGGGFGNITQPYGGNLNIGTTPQQNNLLAQIEGSVGPTSQGGQTVSNAESALNSLMSSNPIDVSSYFQNAVAIPLENTFTQQTLPAIKAQFATSAGGDYSSGLGTATGLATENLNQNLAAANSSLTTQALFNNQANKLAAAQSAPGVAAGATSPLIQALQALTLPTQLQQQSIQNQTGAYNSNIQALLNLLGGGSAFANQGTLQNNTVVQPQGQGLVQEIAPLVGAAAAFSDRRLKKNVRQVGKLKDNTKLYSYDYKWEPSGSRRVGVMAQEIEKKHPSAVLDIGGVKAVDYGKLISDLTS